MEANENGRDVVDSPGESNVSRCFGALESRVVSMKAYEYQSPPIFEADSLSIIDFQVEEPCHLT